MRLAKLLPRPQSLQAGIKPRRAFADDQIQTGDKAFNQATAPMPARWPLAKHAVNR